MRSRFLLPAVVALIQVSGSIHEHTHEPLAEPVDALAVALLLAGPFALTVRRWWPREVLVFVLAITVSYHLLDYPEGPIALSLVVAFIAVFFRGHRTFAWAMLAVSYSPCSGSVTSSGWSPGPSSIARSEPPHGCSRSSLSSRWDEAGASR